MRGALVQVYLVTPTQADELGAYLQRAGWAAGSKGGGMVVHVVCAPGCATEGEALRFVEQRDIIKGDFLLVSGALVGNADLRPALQAHAARRAGDRQAIMTMLLHGGGRSGSTAASARDGSGGGGRGEEGFLLAALDSRTSQLLKLEHADVAGLAAASLGTHMFGERNSITVRACSRRAASAIACACQLAASMPHPIIPSCAIAFWCSCAPAHHPPASMSAPPMSSCC